MAQEWNYKTDELLLSSVNLQLARCAPRCAPGSKFTGANWSALAKSVRLAKDEVVIRLKKIRAEAAHFQQLLEEQYVSCDPETGILSLPHYFWDIELNVVKYAFFKPQKEFKKLKQWCSIFVLGKIPLDDDTISVNPTKRRQRNEVIAESSKMSKSSVDGDSMEMNRELDNQKCYAIFKEWMDSGHLTMVGCYKVHKKLKERGDRLFSYSGFEGSVVLCSGNFDGGICGRREGN